MDKFYLERINLANVGPFEKFDLPFSLGPGIKLICGDNGIGKSTILESLAAPFSNGGAARLKKRAGSDIGHLILEARLNDDLTRFETPVVTFEPDVSHHSASLLNLSKNVINVRATRDFIYQRRDVITRDPQINDGSASIRVSNGIDAQEIKQWFSNRYLMSPHSEDGGWTNAMRKNLASSLEYFSILDSTVGLKGVDVRTFDIEVVTPSGTIPFEYMSSGFKSAYVLLLGIMKEIEYRGVDAAAGEFSGVILIDEIDLHLHPSWQKRISKVLTDAFPNAQIIATTHSPHVIQTAKAGEVIALGRKDDGQVFVRDLPSTNFGYAGWTLDEVLEDVMGVSDTKSLEYRDAVKNFDSALENDDAVSIADALRNLDDMLHPSNPYRKLLRIQAAPFLGNFE